jgi:hypothetical protein
MEHYLNEHDTDMVEARDEEDDAPRMELDSSPQPELVYVLSYSAYDYRGEAPYMKRFIGTFRALLEYVTSYADWKDELPTTRTDAELIKMFDEANGDGQPYVQVFSVVEDKTVLGGIADA